MPGKEYADRSKTIYFETDQELRNLEHAACEAHLPFSHYVREMIRRCQEQPTTPSTDLIQKSAHSREELSKLRRELKDSRAMIEKLETELFALKHSFFLQPIQSGAGQISSELVELLQDGHVWRSDEIMKQLGIDTRNIDAVTILARQLHALQDLKLVEEGTKGWKWIG